MNKKTEEWMKWYNGMDPADKTIYNKDRYIRARVREEQAKKGLVGPPKPPRKLMYGASIQSLYSRLQKKYPDQIDLTKEETKEWAEKRMGKTCYYCGEPNARSIDHIIPLSQGGRHSLSNIQITCGPCNIMKRDFTEFDFLTRCRKITEKRNL